MTNQIKLERPFFMSKNYRFFKDKDGFKKLHSAKGIIEPISLAALIRHLVHGLTALEALPVDIRCCMIKTMPDVLKALVEALKKEIQVMTTTRGMTWNGSNKAVLEKYLNVVVTHLTEEFPDND